jgi:ribosomal protein S18 acetylase RimI-like enzyme
MTPAPDLIAADAVPPDELHAAFTEAFADYLIGPFQLPPAQWPGFLARQAIDLALSRVVRLDGRAAAFAFVAPRDARRWRLGTMGAVPAARGRGAASVLLDDFIERAGAAGIAQVELEVFAQNTRAVRLYASRGFEVRGELHGWSRVAPAAADVEDPDATEVDLDAASAWLDETARRIDDLPLQVLPRVLASSRPSLRAWRHGGAQIVFSPGADAAAPVVVHSLVDRDPAQHDADVLVEALLAHHPMRTIRVPALQRPDVGGEALARAGFARDACHQVLMRRATGT